MWLKVSTSSIVFRDGCGGEKLGNNNKGRTYESDQDRWLISN